jgi:hypothetical protein
VLDLPAQKLRHDDLAVPSLLPHQVFGKMDEEERHLSQLPYKDQCSQASNYQVFSPLFLLEEVLFSSRHNSCLTVRPFTITMIFHCFLLS